MMSTQTKAIKPALLTPAGRLISAAPSPSGLLHIQQRKSINPCTPVLVSKSSVVSTGGNSHMNGMEKPKRKRQRLDHLTQEEKIMRRKLKNRMAAQSARDRKKMKMMDLEGEVQRVATEREQMLSRNAYLEKRVRLLEAENLQLRDRLEAVTGQAVERAAHLLNDCDEQKYFKFLDEPDFDEDYGDDEEIIYDDVNMGDDVGGAAHYMDYRGLSPDCGGTTSGGDVSDTDSGCGLLSSGGSAGTGSPARSVASPSAFLGVSSGSSTSTHSSTSPSSNSFTSSNNPSSFSSSSSSTTSSMDDSFESAVLTNEPQQKDQVTSVGVPVRVERLKSVVLPVVDQTVQDRSEAVGHVDQFPRFSRRTCSESELLSRPTVITSTASSISHQPNDLPLNLTLSSASRTRCTEQAQTLSSPSKTTSSSIKSQAPIPPTSRHRLMHFLILLFSLIVDQNKNRKSDPSDQLEELEEELSYLMMSSSKRPKMAPQVSKLLSSFSPRLTSAPHWSTMLDHLARKHRVRLRAPRSKAEAHRS